MNRKTRMILLAATFVVFIAAAIFAYNSLSQRVSPQNDIKAAQTEGEASEKVKAPDFTVLDIDGNAVKLSDLLGKPVVLNFWASWCPPCMNEMPEFNEVYGEVGGDVSFMMVDLVDGQRETVETGMQYITEQGFSFPVYFDTKHEAAGAYEISSIPTTIFIDKGGYIATKAQGSIDAQALKEGIDLIK
jgi:thiol-disulfide isomerase/thioredoxin